MVIKGLEGYGEYELADMIAENHIRNVADIYFNFIPDEEKIASEERYGDDYKTIWECYSPEYPEPATRWDNTLYSRQDFVGWSGLGPIAMLIENIIGIKLNIPKNEIKWRINRADKHGVKNLHYIDSKVSLIAEPVNEKLNLNITASYPFNLKLFYKGKKHTKEINKGVNILTIE